MVSGLCSVFITAQTWESQAVLLCRDFRVRPGLVFLSRMMSHLHVFLLCVFSWPGPKGGCAQGRCHIYGGHCMNERIQEILTCNVIMPCKYSTLQHPKAHLYHFGSLHNGLECLQFIKEAWFSDKHVYSYIKLNRCKRFESTVSQNPLINLNLHSEGRIRVQLARIYQSVFWLTNWGWRDTGKNREEMKKLSKVFSICKCGDKNQLIISFTLWIYQIYAPISFSWILFIDRTIK